MESNVQVSKGLFAIICGVAAGVLGGFDSLLKLYLALMAADFLFGCIKGIKAKNFSSTIARWGFINKVIALAIVALCVLLDEVIDKTCFARNIAIIWFSLCEGASIFENLAAIGVPFPDGVREIFIQAQKGFSINFSQVVNQIIKNYVPMKTKEDENNEPIFNVTDKQSKK